MADPIGLIESTYSRPGRTAGVAGALALIIPGWFLQDSAVLHGDALAGLILALTATFLVFQRMREPGQPFSAHVLDRALAIFLVLLGIVAAMGAALSQSLRINLAGLALALVALGLATAAGGRARFSGLFVPILVLYVLVPAIPVFEASLTYPMRALSAILATLLLSLGPGSVSLLGTEIYYGDLTVSVTSACDGLTLLQNIGWIAWWSVLLRHDGFWNRLLHTTIAIPAVLIANTLRIVALAVWASWQGPEVLASAGHAYIAWATVALAAGLFLAMENLFEPTRNRSDQTQL